MFSGKEMVQYIKPFAQVCMKVFKQFVKLQLTVERPYIFNGNNVGDWDIFAVIGFSGEVRGSFAITMKKNVAFKLTNIITGKTYTEIDEDVIDAIGEIVNIIAGNVKVGFENAFNLEISLPLVVKGEGHSISWIMNTATVFCVPFKIFENDELVLSISLEKKEEKKK